MPTRLEEEEALKERERVSRRVSRNVTTNLANVVDDIIETNSTLSSPSGRVHRPVSINRELGTPNDFGGNNSNNYHGMSREEEEVMIKQQERHSAGYIIQPPPRLSSKIPNLASMVEETEFVSPSGNTSRPTFSMSRPPNTIDDPPVQLGAVAIGPSQGLGQNNSSYNAHMTREEEEIMIKQRERAELSGSRHRASQVVPNLANLVMDAPNTSLATPFGQEEFGDYQPDRSIASTLDSDSVQRSAVDSSLNSGSNHRSLGGHGRGRASVTVPNLAHQVLDAPTLTRDPTTTFVSSSRNSARASTSQPMSVNSFGSVTTTSSRASVVVPNLAHQVLDAPTLTRDPTTTFVSSSRNSARTSTSQPMSMNSFGSVTTTSSSQTQPLSQKEMDLLQKEQERQARSHSAGVTPGAVAIGPISSSSITENHQQRQPSQQELDLQLKERERQASQTSRHGSTRASTIVPNLASQVTIARFDAVAQMLGEEDIGDQTLHSNSVSINGSQNSQPARNQDSEDTVRARYQAATLAMGGILTQEDEDQLMKDREKEARQYVGNQEGSPPSRDSDRYSNQAQYQRDMAVKFAGRSSTCVRPSMGSSSSDTIRQNIDQAREDALAKTRGAASRRNQGGDIRAHQGDNNDLILASAPQVAPGALAVVDGQAEIRAPGHLTLHDLPEVENYAAPPSSNSRIFVEHSSGNVPNEITNDDPTIATNRAVGGPDVEDQTQAGDTMMAVAEVESVLPHVGVEERLENENKNETKSNRKWYIVGTLLLVLMGGIAAGVVIALGGDSDDSDLENSDVENSDVDVNDQTPSSSPVSANTFGPESERVQQIRTILSSFNVSFDDDLLDPESPPYAALRWIGDQDVATQLESIITLRTRYIMAVFYYSMNGREWLTEGNNEWLDTRKNVCDWDFVTCLAGEVQSIEVPNDINMEGSLPSELNALPLLEKISIKKNRVRGFTAPLTNIETLELEECDLGELFLGIPGDILEMTNLRSLSLLDNNLVGTISADIQQLSLLGLLDLQGNSLEGTLTTELSSLSKLQDLRLSRNNFEGNLMDVIQNLSLLQRLRAADNSFSGPLDSRLTNYARLERIQVENNDLSGTFPNLVWDLPNLGLLDISNNRFQGSIGSEIGRATQLQYVFLSRMQLSGSIPTQIGLFNNLIDFRASGTLLSGSIPTEFGNHRRMNRLWLDVNELTGPIPTELGNAQSLVSLQLDSNSLTGILPTELGGLLQLSRLRVALNQLEGAVPDEVCDIPTLVELAVAPLDCGTCSKCTG